MSRKIILDLCGGFGGWSKPYAEDPEGRYLVVVVDPLAETEGRRNTITLRMTAQQFSAEYVNRDGTVAGERVHGVLAHPPCTDFAVSGARWWKGKAEAEPERLAGFVDIVETCLRIVEKVKPKFWAMENPVGRMGRVTSAGKWSYTFQPYEYGADYSKRTCIWGNTTKPVPTTPDNVPVNRGKLHKLPPSADRWRIRSLTPEGFALAFFNANQ